MIQTISIILSIVIIVAIPPILIRLFKLYTLYDLLGFVISGATILILFVILLKLPIEEIKLSSHYIAKVDNQYLKLDSYTSGNRNNSTTHKQYEYYIKENNQISSYHADRNECNIFITNDKPYVDIYILSIQE